MRLNSYFYKDTKSDWMSHLSENFLKGAKDYRYLLDRNYPQKSIVKLVGDRYQLRSVERTMLFRGIGSHEKSKLRKQKIIVELPVQAVIYIDGYNAIRTVGSYLSGKTVFVSTDSFLRDAAEMHRSTLREKILTQTLNLLFDYLLDNKVRKLTVFLDQPISKSGELASNLNKLINENGFYGEATTVHSPDHHLKKVEEGIVCTADSVIIDECKVPVFDLARAILESKYQPAFIDFTALPD